MSLLRAAFLALVQGITEFLPISSSAHLILVPYLLGWPDQGLSFDIATNTGTLLAVILYFRKDLADLGRGAVAGLRGRDGEETRGANGSGGEDEETRDRIVPRYRVLDNEKSPENRSPAGGADGEDRSVAAGSEPGGREAGEEREDGPLAEEGDVRVEGMPPMRFLLALVIGTVPVAITGLLIADWVATAGRNPTLIAGTSIGFGLLLLAADQWGRRRRGLETLTLTDALLVGLAQAAALVPGTSRSGITMTMALFLGYRRPAAARFSFLLSIPVGLLATGYDLLKMVRGGVPADDLAAMAVGLVVAAISAYLVIGALLAWLRRQTMTPFVVYRVLLGIVILVVAAMAAE